MSNSLEDLAARGPHAVGVVSLEIDDPHVAGRSLPTDLWFPADPDSAAHAADAEHPLGQPHQAVVGPKPAPGPLPLVVFSHGNSGLRQQSTFLTTHLASHGFVVAAPDHSGNTFLEMAALKSEEERKQVHMDSRERRPRDLQTVIERACASDGSWPAIDTGAIGAAGHSFGGWTILKLATLEPRLRGLCGLAPASEPFVGRKAFAAGELPLRRSLPCLVIAGLDDVLVDLETSVHPLVGRLGPESALVGVESADHFHFCDGIELLHGLHERNDRPNQPRPAKPYADQLPQERMHRLVGALVTQHFDRCLRRRSDAFAALSDEALGGLDPSLRRLAPSATGATA